MGIAEAKKYIGKLHKKQANPYLWPDFLTGLPDKAAIISKMETISPKLGKYSIAYVRIANIHPFIIKYGPDRHAEIIQWAAAILKTTFEKCRNSFVGTLSTHDFIVMCETQDMGRLVKDAGRLFSSRIKSYYSAEDLQKRRTFSFQRDGEKVSIGLMRFVSVIADRRLPAEKGHLLQDMGQVCVAMEGTDDDLIMMTEDMICRP